jgi:phosphate transport system protein
MSRRPWHRPRDATTQGRDATLAQVIETVDRTAPATKADLAEAVGISEQYCSELLQDLKCQDVVRKAYVVDDAAVYAAAGEVSWFTGGDGSGIARRDRDLGGVDAGADGSAPSTEPSAERRASVLELLERLDDVTASQYEAVRTTYVGEEPAEPPGALESLTNERYFAVIDELKSYTLTTDWPGNRVASDLATIATNLEIVGDRACFIADVVGERSITATGVVDERVRAVFDAGGEINDLLGRVLFECDLDAFEPLQAREEAVHRDLDELFELVTAYDRDVYAYLVTVTRALERAIYYWVDAAEIAVRLHTGVQPEHARV